MNSLCQCPDPFQCQCELPRADMDTSHNLRSSSSNPPLSSDRAHYTSNLWRHAASGFPQNAERSSNSPQPPSPHPYYHNRFSQPHDYTSPDGQLINNSLRGTGPRIAPSFERAGVNYYSADTYRPWSDAQRPGAALSSPSGYSSGLATVAAPLPDLVSPAHAGPSSLAFIPYATSADTPPTAFANAPLATAADAPPAAGAKRRGRPKGKGNKKQKTADSRPPERADVPGVGPRPDAPASASSTEQDVAQHPTLASKRYTSLLAREGRGGQTGASDVYYFLFGGLKWESPLQETFDNGKLSMTRPSDKVYKALVCRLCYPGRRQWLNTPNQTGCIRNHLILDHFTTWRGTVLALRLKGWNEPVERTTADSLEMAKDFTPQQLGVYLVEWVAAEDMSLNVLESPYLRRILLYTGQGTLSERDIPHRTKLAELILKQFSVKYEEIRADILTSLGRIAFTTDIWSRQNLEGYMALTAHYIVRCRHDGHWILRSKLVAFRHLPGSHTGERIAETFLHILDELGCKDNMSLVTADNASPNNTAMQFMARWLGEKGIVFYDEGNRVRCFPHVVNVGTQTGLEVLKEPTLCLDFDVPLPPELLADASYRRALEEDLIGSLRRIAVWIRASDGRRNDLKAIIRDGNAMKRWLDDAKQPEEIPVLSVLRDVDTRWSAVFLMTDRVMYLYRPIDELLHLEKYADTEAPEIVLSHTQLQALEDVRVFLSVLHMAQEMVSGQKTPTLAYVLPAYALLVETLDSLKLKLAKIAHVIEVTKQKLKYYMNKALSTEAYAISMVLNPMIKFEWVRKYGEPGDLERHREYLYKAMMKHYMHAQAKGARIPRRSGVQPISARHVSISSAARAPQTGLGRLASFRRGLMASSSQSSRSEPVDEPEDAGQPTASASEAAEAELRERALQIIKDEVERYEQAGIIDDEHPLANDFDILRFWQTNQGVFPNMIPVALDLLPVQASAVPCERVFSSSKETDTERRSKLDPVMMETLQILKYALKDDLNFTEEFLATEQECAALTIDPALVQQLYEDNKIEDLVRLFEEAEQYGVLESAGEHLNVEDNE